MKWRRAQFVSLVRANVLWAQQHLCPLWYSMLVNEHNFTTVYVLSCVLWLRIWQSVFVSGRHTMSSKYIWTATGLFFHCAVISLCFVSQLNVKVSVAMYFWCLALFCDRESASVSQYSQCEMWKSDHNTEQRAQIEGKRMQPTNLFSC